MASCGGGLGARTSLRVVDPHAAAAGSAAPRCAAAVISLTRPDQRGLPDAWNSPQRSDFIWSTARQSSAVKVIRSPPRHHPPVGAWSGATWSVSLRETIRTNPSLKTRPGRTRTTPRGRSIPEVRSIDTASGRRGGQTPRISRCSGPGGDGNCVGRAVAGGDDDVDEAKRRAAVWAGSAPSSPRRRRTKRGYLSWSNHRSSVVTVARDHSRHLPGSGTSAARGG